MGKTSKGDEVQHIHVCVCLVYINSVLESVFEHALDIKVQVKGPLFDLC